MDLGSRRHQARERALELLYEAEMKSRSALEIVRELPVAPDDYTITLVEAAQSHRERAEALVAEFSHDWPLERLAVIDRLIMVLAIGELLSEDAPPTAVVLNEAVELARTYSTEGSGAFVNGVLSSCARHLER
ncbi:MAG TPA: transcription antitermination factor NusB [Acidimicrobiales bacterium]|nr:transcription antitermination factor NusB [Acidimicrobiales bacterium]